MNSAFPLEFDVTFTNGKPATSETTPVEAIVDLLDSAADFDFWTLTDPNVFEWWERSQDERGPGQGQPPELHVWQPTSAPLTRLTADNALFDELPSIEIYVYSLDKTETAQLARDVIQFTSDYMSDREQNTPFADIVPTNVEDYREQKLREKTDHFVYTVEVEITRLTETGIN